ncbi:MAG TPA: hypothetical protein VK786_02680 [bacterium]|nr:hypothetical protein [bacterium]
MRAPESFPALLASRDRKQASKTAPPEGLILWNVEYGVIPRPGRAARASGPGKP